MTALHDFAGSDDGAGPYAGVVEAAKGNFYGTTTGGGAHGANGTVFAITPAGTKTTLHSFAGSDGANPYGGLIQATDGNFYGTTAFGGNGGGTVFKITAAGTLTTLHNFCPGDNCSDGAESLAALVQATDGRLYGTTFSGDGNFGTIFVLDLGLGPFVGTLPAAGKVGAAISILGSNLTGSTGVSFDGTMAAFTVVSNSEITTTVPTGATTGSMRVMTPQGTLQSSVAFRVTPQIKSFKPTSGPVGTVVTISGVSLTQAKQATFGGVAATRLMVISDTQMTVAVPTGAKTGRIAVTTAGGAAVSAGGFTVTP